MWIHPPEPNDLKNEGLWCQPLCERRPECEVLQAADNTHDSGRRKATNGGEALIATEPLRERLPPNQTQADSGEPRAEDASGRTSYESASENGSRVRPCLKTNTPEMIAVVAIPTTSRFDLLMSISSPAGT